VSGYAPHHYGEDGLSRDERTGEAVEDPSPGFGLDWTPSKAKARAFRPPDEALELPVDPHEPLEVALQGQGWSVIGRGATYRRWQYGNGAGPMVVVPLNPTFADYDELIEQAETVRRNVLVGLVEELPGYPVELTTTPKMTEEMLRRGWRPPAEVIATEEELIALPDGSVLLTKDNVARIVYRSPEVRLSTPFFVSCVPHLARLFPAQLLWRAEEPES
jgi:hypothetical protein